MWKNGILKMESEKGKIGILIILILASILLSGIEGKGKTLDPDNGDTRNEARYITIDFKDIDIEILIKFISELTGKNFIIDERVKGKVSIISPSKISIEEAYKVFESVLEVNGYTAIESENVIKIVPIIDATSKDIEIRMGKGLLEREDKLVTQIIHLKNSDPDQLKEILNQFISKTSIIASYPKNKMLIVTDNLSNIGRILKIIEVIDVEREGKELSVISLENAPALEISKYLKEVFESDEEEIRIVPDQRTNRLIILSSRKFKSEIEDIIKILDTERKEDEGDIHVYYLKNADAEYLSRVLIEISKRERDERNINEESKGIQIVAEKATNSIIINGKKEEYLEMENLIKSLDTPRRMIYLEALIMEVSMSRNYELGVEWFSGISAGENKDRNIGVFGGSTTGNYLMPYYKNEAATLKTGLMFGVMGNVISIGGIKFNNIGAVIRVLRTKSDVNIISTPQVMTMDNEEAEIKIADNIPFLTRKETTETGSDYSNYEFKDVGVSLKIKPQINNERFVKLKISQEVSQVVNQEKIGLPKTLKRIVNTTVVIKDGQTIVIGGLLDETGNKTIYKVPLLGDIPVLGELFKYSSETNGQKNMYMFLTPHIIENKSEADKIYSEKKEDMEKKTDGKN